MLVKQFKYQPGQVINLKLVSGDEICGELVDFDGREYQLRRPCIVVTTPEGIGLLQAMFGHDPTIENIHYRDQHVISICKTHKKMEDHYLMVVSDEPMKTQEPVA